MKLMMMIILILNYDNWDDDNQDENFSDDDNHNDNVNADDIFSMTNKPNFAKRSSTVPYSRAIKI